MWHFRREKMRERERERQREKEKTTLKGDLANPGLF